MTMEQESCWMRWLEGEAEAQGLPLSAEDLEAIARIVLDNKNSLAKVRPIHTWGLVPPYEFIMQSTQEIDTRWGGPYR